jgi:exodeoxyribonuclease-3
LNLGGRRHRLGRQIPESGPMKIATFNINGIKARQDALTAYLQGAGADVDVICLQEIKSVDENFPRAHFEAMGYRVETHGQKSFNGVAILSKLPLTDIRRGLDGDADDTQARWIEAVVQGATPIRLCGLYLPNGSPVEFDGDTPHKTGKYGYKLAWMQRMRARLAEVLSAEEAAVFCGDYNIIPADMDAAKPEAWAKDALALPDSRAAYRRMITLGLTDALRTLNPKPGLYSYWDFQAGAWERNNGIRIDHHLLTPQAADLLIGAGVDKSERGLDRPSDHVPVWITLAV